MGRHESQISKHQPKKRPRTEDKFCIQCGWLWPCPAAKAEARQQQTEITNVTYAHFF